MKPHHYTGPIPAAVLNVDGFYGQTGGGARQWDGIKMKTFTERVLLVVPVRPWGKNRNNGASETLAKGGRSETFRPGGSIEY